MRTLLSGVSFSPPASYAVGQSPTAIAVGDFNGDGRPDMATANANISTVSVLLGNGDGTFQAATSFGVGGSPGSLVVGDFNGDGHQDLAVGCHNNVSVLLGNGDGTFQTARNVTTAGPASVAVGDFNADGKLDLAVANLFVISNADTGSLSVLLGNGDGTFQTAQDYVFGRAFPGSIAVGDFNGDGKLDLATANTLLIPGTLSVLLGNGDGTFQTAQDFAPGGDAEALAVGDFNDDGKLDLATLNNFTTSGGTDVGVLLGNGDGTFQTATSFPTGTHRSFDGNAVASIKVGDFNGDGKPDLVVANTNSNLPGLRLLLGNGDGTFQTAQGLAAGVLAVSLAANDFNGDGKPDLAFTNGPYAAAGLVGVALDQFATMTTVTGPAGSAYAHSVTYTATVNSGDSPVTVGTVTFLDGNTAVSPALAVNANGQASFSIATLNAGGHTITAAYSGTPGGAGTTGFGASAGNTGLVINPVLLTATAVNFNATAGAPFTGAIAAFTNPDPYGTAASYTAIIDWGDGSTSTGTITGTGILTVSGSHTYADPAIDPASVRISHNLGDTTTAMVYPTANVTSVGQDVQRGLTGGIGFWHGKNGQALINSFNGGPNSTALSTWLASTLTNLYGDGAGVNDLRGEPNFWVAQFYQSQIALPGSNLEAEVLASALNVYATTLSLGGTTGQAYGFTVSADGLGADSFNVGADGAAFGVASKTTLNVYELLESVDRQTLYGVLYNGDTTLRKEANDLFDALNKAGAIS